MPASLTAELIVRGGRIFCGAGLPIAEAVAIAGGRVLATGSSAEIDGLRGTATRLFELEGRFACPGLIDSHLHLLPLGLTLGEVDARPGAAVSIAVLMEGIRARAASLRPGTWIVARGYDHHQLAERRHPRREDLDRAAPLHPVFLTRSCGHVAVANSAALALAGVDDGTADPPGGRLGREDGQLTGLLEESARDLVRRVLPGSSDGELVDAIERAGRSCLAAGITSVMDAAVGARAGYREVAAYFAARRDGRLPIRANLALVGGEGGIVEAAHADGLSTGSGDGVLTIGPAKLFADGSAGARTAALSAGYVSEPCNQGLLYLSDGRLRDLVRDYHGRGFQLATHAVGDLAIERVLDAYEAVSGEPGSGRRRHRIEHATFTSPDQIRRMARLGVVPVPQPIFLHDYGGMYLAHVGEVRTAAAFPLRSWLAAGLSPAASTDAPISAIAPLRNLAAMIERRGSRGGVPGDQESIDPETALRCYTEVGAFANHAEMRTGRLLPGMAADIAVFSVDLLSAGASEISRGTCEATILGGDIVRQA